MQVQITKKYYFETKQYMKIVDEGNVCIKIYIYDIYIYTRNTSQHIPTTSYLVKINKYIQTYICVKQDKAR